ncbi:MAG: ribonuclease III [Gammaproteobacteria bacterium]|nr:ribonuclease III [Alteromonadaceae bacterium]NVK88103.1 ribonuclease III [Gammaproteobacteria bacterium]
MSETLLLDGLQKALNYRFRDAALLRQALTHRSAQGAHNERLEFLGDSILGFVIAAKLYQLFPEANEGQMTRLRARLVKEKSLAEIAHELALGELLNLGSGELKSGGYRRASILSDAFEALLGAVYLDSGLPAAEQVIHHLYLSRYQALSLSMAEKDPKTRLQEWLQSRRQALPDYQVVKSEGKDHNKMYWVECHLTNSHQSEAQTLATTASGSSRRKAEQSAAEKMLEKLGV